MSEFEKLAFRTTCDVFLSPLHTFATPKDDLFGTRSKDNQFNALSARKADREGHLTDTIADTFFRVNLMVRFRRRGEKQDSNVRMLL